MRFPAGRRILGAYPGTLDPLGSERSTAMTAIFVDQAIDQLRATFRGDLVRPGDPGYDDARQVRNGLIDRRPAVIARCTGTADVVAAVNFAREHELLLSVCGGGHNVAGTATNDGGIVIDL